MKLLTESQLTSIMITIPSINLRLAFDLHNLAVSRAFREKDQEIQDLKAEVTRLRVSSHLATQEASTMVSEVKANGSNSDDADQIVRWLRESVGDSTTVRALNTKKIADRIEAREYKTSVS